LLVFGKGKEPLLVLPLNKAAREQKWSLEFTAEREGDASARVTLLLVGKYEASFLVTAPSEYQAPLLPACRLLFRSPCFGCRRHLRTGCGAQPSSHNLGSRSRRDRGTDHLAESGFQSRDLRLETDGAAQLLDGQVGE